MSGPLACREHSVASSQGAIKYVCKLAQKNLKMLLFSMKNKQVPGNWKQGSGFVLVG